MTALEYDVRELSFLEVDQVSGAVTGGLMIGAALVLTLLVFREIGKRDGAEDRVEQCEVPKPAN